MFQRTVTGKRGEDVKFSVSKTFGKAFVRKHLGWTWRRVTTAASKLPEDWEKQGDETAYRVAALCKLHNIPPELVVNSNQAAIYVRPAAKQTYETKGVKVVRSLRKDEKRQITGMVSSTSSGSMLPLQLIFQGKTTAVVPNHVEAREAVKKGWDLTNSKNHWSNQTTMKRFVEKVLDPWRIEKCKELGLDSSKQKMVWLIDCWKVHTSEEFRNWLKENHPLVHYLYVATNCTSKLQPTDVVLQRPFKHGFRKQFEKWQSELVASQLAEGVRPEDVELQVGIKKLRELLIGWLLSSWGKLCKQMEMIQKGWALCRLGSIHIPCFQDAAMGQCLQRGLLAKLENHGDEPEVIEDKLESGAFRSAGIEEIPLVASVHDVMSVCLEEEHTLEIFRSLS